MMDVHVALSLEPSTEASLHLKDLRQMLIEDCGVDVEAESTEPEPRTKDPGLLLALNISGLALSAISTLVATLSYWRSTRAEYSINISRGEVNLNIDRIKPSDFQEIAEKLENARTTEDILVAISK